MQTRTTTAPDTTVEVPEVVGELLDPPVPTDPVEQGGQGATRESAVPKKPPGFLRHISLPKVAKAALLVRLLRWVGSDY